VAQLHERYDDDDDDDDYDDDISTSPMNCPSIPALEERLLLVPHGQLLVF